MLALHSGIVKHPWVYHANITGVVGRVSVWLRILNQAKHCPTLRVCAIVCGMTVDREAGPVFPAWSFADRLRKARTTVGMTQEEFATAIGVKEGTLAAWESDRSQPRSRDIVDVAKRIEALTRIATAWILGIDDTPPTPPGSSWPAPRQQTPTPTRHLRAVIRTDPPVSPPDVNDDALAYVHLAEGRPRSYQPDDEYCSLRPAA